MTKDPCRVRLKFFKQMDPERHFFKLFDHMEGVSFFAKSRDGELLFLSQDLMKMYNFKKEEDFIGKTDFDVLPRHLAEKYAMDDKKIIESQEGLLNMIELFLNEQGIPRWFVTNKLPIFDKRGEVMGVMGTIKALERSISVQYQNLSISPAIQYLEDNFKENVSIAMISKLCGISVRQLERNFKRHFNTTPQQFVIKRRILEACELMRSGDVELCTLSTDIGFYDQSSFSKQFRKHMGMTPRQYGKKFRA